MPWKAWTTETLSSTELQSYLQDQTVLRFDSASQRDAQLTTVQDGMVTYQEDTDRLWTREYGGWRPLNGAWPNAANNAGLPSSQLQHGDRIYSVAHRCTLTWTGSWTQSTMAIHSDPVATYISAGKALGITSWHNGFLYFDTALNRLYACAGGETFYHVGGAALAVKTDGWTQATDWAFNTGSSNTFVRSLGGGMAQFQVSVNRTGAALGVPVNGDLGNTAVGTVPVEYQPVQTITAVSGASGRLCAGILGSDGIVYLTSTAPGSNIATGDTISLGGTYRLKNTTM